MGFSQSNFVCLRLMLRVCVCAVQYFTNKRFYEALKGNTWLFFQVCSRIEQRGHMRVYV